MAVADSMAADGWVSSRTAVPPAIHLMLSPAHKDYAAQYLNDLSAATAAAPAAGSRSVVGSYT